MPALAGLPDPRTLVALAQPARQPVSGAGAPRTAGTLEIKCDRSAVLLVALAMIVEDKQAIRNQTRRPRDQGASRPSESLAGGGEMPGPDDEAAQPPPPAPEEAIPAPIPLPAEDVASPRSAAPAFFPAPAQPPPADRGALTDDSPLSHDPAGPPDV